MGISEGFVVSSPTYTLLQIYPCAGLDLWHLDLYRIHGPEDLDSTGYRDGVGGARVLAIEWVEREPEALPAERLIIEFDYDDGGRTATINAAGVQYERMSEQALHGFLESRGTPRPKYSSNNSSQRLPQGITESNRNHKQNSGSP